MANCFKYLVLKKLFKLNIQNWVKQKILVTIVSGNLVFSCLILTLQNNVP